MCTTANARCKDVWKGNGGRKFVVRATHVCAVPCLCTVVFADSDMMWYKEVMLITRRSPSVVVPVQGGGELLMVWHDRSFMKP